MNIIEPNKLHPGDTIAVIAPCGCIDIEKIYQAKKYFENFGYKVKLGSNVEKQERYLAGTDIERLEDLHNAFSDKEVNAIICARGGYGAIRLINKIDYNLIRNNPKIFCGFSDVTALSMMILKHAGLITYSAPMAQSDFAADEVDEFTKNSFFNTMTSENFEIRPENILIYKSGEAQGILFGGNLSTTASLCGVDFVPEEKFIFFAEDLNEPAYKIDRYFTQLLNMENFRKNLGAILLGDFLDVDNPQYLDEFFKELAQKLEIPIIAGYPFTHDTSKTTVPIGAGVILKDGIIIKV